MPDAIYKVSYFQRTLPILGNGTAYKHKIINLLEFMCYPSEIGRLITLNKPIRPAVLLRPTSLNHFCFSDFKINAPVSVSWRLKCILSRPLKSKGPVMDRTVKESDA